MESFIQYVLPAIVLFIAQTVLCLWCKNKYIRLIPSVIALGISAYHIGIIIRTIQTPSPWNVMAWGYLALTVMPVLAGAGFGWMIYVVKLMIREVKALKN